MDNLKLSMILYKIILFKSQIYENLLNIND